MKLALRMYCETVSYENKERSGEFRVLCHRIHHLQSCFVYCTTTMCLTSKPVDYVWWYLALCRREVFPLHTNSMLKVKKLSPFLTSSPLR